MRVLLTGARGLPALAAARQLHLAGHEVLAGDTAPRHATARSRAVRGSFVLPSPRFAEDAFARALAALVEQHGIDAIVPTGEETLYVARQRHRLRCRVVADRIERLVALHDKWRFQREVAARGLPAPRTWALRSSAHLASLVRAHGPLVVKPAFSRFGRHTRVVAGRHDIDAALSGELGREIGRALAHGRTLLAQEQIPGVELCASSVLHEGALLAHVCYRSRYRLPLGPGYYFEPVAHPGVRAWVERFLAGTGFTGCVGFDFIETRAGALFALECNPRMTSGLLLFPEDGSLGRALLGQGTAEPDLVHPVMIGLAMLGALRGLRSRADARAWWRALGAARDAFWRAGDPGPFWGQLAAVPHLWRIACRHRLGLREATTHHTEWNG